MFDHLKFLLDLDECATANHSCSTHAHCSNVIGSFQCTCNDGYSGDGKTCQGTRRPDYTWCYRLHLKQATFEIYFH